MFKSVPRRIVRILREAKRSGQIDHPKPGHGVEQPRNQIGGNLVRRREKNHVRLSRKHFLDVQRRDPRPGSARQTPMDGPEVGSSTVGSAEETHDLHAGVAGENRRKLATGVTGDADNGDARGIPNHFCCTHAKRIARALARRPRVPAPGGKFRRTTRNTGPHGPAKPLDQAPRVFRGAGREKNGVVSGDRSKNFRKRRRVDGEGDGRGVRRRRSDDDERAGQIRRQNELIDGPVQPVAAAPGNGRRIAAFCRAWEGPARGTA